MYHVGYFDILRQKCENVFPLFHLFLLIHTCGTRQGIQNLISHTFVRSFTGGFTLVVVCAIS